MTTPGSIRNDRGRASVWRVPNYLFEARGSFLGGRTDPFIATLSRWRAIVGLVVVVALLAVYPAYGSSQHAVATEVVGGKEVPVEGTTKYVTNWGYSVILATVLSVALMVVFAVVIIWTTRPFARWSVARHLTWPFVTLVVVYAGSIAGGYGVSTLIYRRELPWSSHESVLVHAASFVLFVALLAVLVVWAVRSTVIVVAGNFRAEDAHPLAIPVVSTIVVWTLAIANAASGIPKGLPLVVGLLTVVGGPLVVTAINVLACRRLWRDYRTLLFRDGPVPSTP